MSLHRGTAPTPGDLSRISSLTRALMTLGLTLCLPTLALAQTPPPCPTNQVIANSFGVQVSHSSSGPTDSRSQGGSSAYYDLPLCAFSLTGDHGFGQVIAADVYSVQGLPPGTPVALQARLRVRGSYNGQGVSGTNGSLTITFREGASNSITLFKSTTGRPGFFTLDSTLVLNVNTVAGGNFTLNYDLRAGGSSQGGGGMLGPDTERWLTFGPLAAGVSVVSCQDFHDPQPVPLVPEVIDADYRAGACTVRWRVDPEARGVLIERSVDGAGWESRGTAQLDSRGGIELRDADVEPGRSYAWRLNINGRAMAMVELTIPLPDGPGELRLAALAAHTNGLLLSYATSAGGPARLELYSVTGRLVDAVEIAGSESAAGTRRLLATRTAPAGTYWVRLTQGPLARTLKVTLLP